MDGIRDSKEINGVKHDYVTQGGNVALDTWTDKSGKHRMEFVYDNSGSPYSVILDGKTYYYVLNHLGDVVRIVDESGNTVTEYVYNSWGEILNNISVNKTMIGRLNPFRYRSYYYDIETGMYYLQNRYYDSVSHRFINMDTSISNAGKYIAGYNLFAYCINNPVNMSDHSGEWHKWIQKGIRVARNIAKNIAKKLPKISPQKSHHNKNKGSKKRIHQKKHRKLGQNDRPMIKIEDHILESLAVHMSPLMEIVGRMEMMENLNVIMIIVIMEIPVIIHMMKREGIIMIGMDQREDLHMCLKALILLMRLQFFVL